MDLTCYNSYYEVNLSVLEENFKKISRFVSPAQIIPVLKADAYGMGALEIAKTLTERCGCKTLACSQTYEGLVLREGGITDAEILIMGPVLHDTLPCGSLGYADPPVHPGACILPFQGGCKTGEDSKSPD